MRVIEIPTEYRRLFDDDWREAAVYGGRFSLKSHTVARFLLIRARERKTRVACFREYQNSIAESSHQLLKDLILMYGLSEFRVTDSSIVNTVNGSDFLFKGLHHNEQNVKSTEGIDIAWVEEAQTVSSASIDVLTPTVRKPGSKIIYTYNRLFEDDPVHKRLVTEGRPNTLVLNLNYEVAVKYGMMPDVIRLEMEDDREKRPGLYAHKWMGEPNNMEGRILKGWTVVDEVPATARLWRRGLDFGYTNDPTTVTAVYEYDGGIVLDEELYQKGMLNSQIADFIKNLPEWNVLIKADSAEPKSIDELSLYGLTVLGANKGQGSVNQGLQRLQAMKVLVTRRSVHLLEEYRNYMWATDKDGRVLNVPIDAWNHCIDGTRYAVEEYQEKRQPSRRYAGNVGGNSLGFGSRPVYR